MAKSKNSTHKNQNSKAHRNGITRPNKKEICFTQGGNNFKLNSLLAFFLIRLMLYILEIEEEQ